MRRQLSIYTDLIILMGLKQDADPDHYQNTLVNSNYDWNVLKCS